MIILLNCLTIFFFFLPSLLHSDLLCADESCMLTCFQDPSRWHVESYYAGAHVFLWHYPSWSNLEPVFEGHWYSRCDHSLQHSYAYEHGCACHFSRHHHLPGDAILHSRMFATCCSILLSAGIWQLVYFI